jgi:hypothetical protein
MAAEDGDKIIAMWANEHIINQPTVKLGQSFCPDRYCVNRRD